MSDRRPRDGHWQPPTGPKNWQNKTNNNHAPAPGQASLHRFGTFPAGTSESRTSNGVTSATWPAAEEKQFDDFMTLHWSEAMCLSQPYRRKAEEVFFDVSESMTSYKFNRSSEECYIHWCKKLRNLLSPFHICRLLTYTLRLDRVTQHKHQFKHTLDFPVPPGEIDDKKILSKQPSRPIQTTSGSCASRPISTAQTSSANMIPIRKSRRSRKRPLKSAQGRDSNATISNQFSTTENIPGSRYRTTSSPYAEASACRESGTFQGARHQASTQQHSTPRPTTPSASGRQEYSSVQGTPSKASAQRPSQTSAQQVTPKTTSAGLESMKPTEAAVLNAGTQTVTESGGKEAISLQGNSSKASAKPISQSSSARQATTTRTISAGDKSTQPFQSTAPKTDKTSSQYGLTHTGHELPEKLPTTAERHPMGSSTQTDAAFSSDHIRPTQIGSLSSYCGTQQDTPKIISGRRNLAESIASNDFLAPLRHVMSEMRIPPSSTPSQPRASTPTSMQAPSPKTNRWTVRGNTLLEEAVTGRRLRELQKRYHERADLKETSFWSLIVEDISGFGVKKSGEECRDQWEKTFYSPGGLDIIRKEVDTFKDDDANKIEDEAEVLTEDTSYGEIPGLDDPANGEWSDRELRNLDALVLKHKGASFYDQDGPKKVLNTGLTWENICHLHNNSGFSRSTHSIMYMWTHVRDKKCPLPRPPMRYEIEPKKKQKRSRKLADNEYEVIQVDEVDAQRLEASAKRARPADDEDDQNDADNDTPRAKRISRRSPTPDNVMNRLHEAQDKIKRLQEEIAQNEIKKRASDEKIDHVNQRLAELEKEKQALLADQIAATDESAGYAAEIAASTDMVISVQNAINLFWH